jgi:predicted phosphodiesterase
MSRYGIISDIHGNLHALQATFARLATLELDGIICLGDIVGYGPYPDACLDLVVKHCSITVQGNHDEAVVDPRLADMFNGAAREAIHWTIDNLGPLHLAALNKLKTIEYVERVVLCIHDCPAAGPTDYVHDKVIAAMAFAGVDVPICLLGHTHVPMVFETEIEDQETALGPTDVTAYLPQDGIPITIEEGRRYICNPGSVGQPRDSDPRASFAVLDLNDSTFTVHRQEYDVDAAQESTSRAGLPPILAERLALGA